MLEHTHSAPVRDVDELEAKRAYLRGRAFVDFGLGAHVWEGEQDLAALAGAGISFFKVFTCTTHGIPGCSYGRLPSVFAEASEAGVPCLVHAEDESITENAEIALRSRNRTDGNIIPEWRRPEAEAVAVSAVVHLADQAKAKVVIAHVSSAPLVALIDSLRRPDSRIVVESCPQYMELLRDGVSVHGSFRKFTPPARGEGSGDLLAMWSQVAKGGIDYIASDHAPSTRAQKEKGSIWDAPFGLPGLDTTMSLLLTAAATDKISYQDLVQRYSTTPARVYGLYPRKGSLQPGADADLLIVDPSRRRVLRDEDIHSKAGWSPYLGREMTGKVMKTFLRGQLLAEDGVVIDASSRVGRFLGPSWIP